MIINIRSKSGDIDFERPPGRSSDQLSITVREDTSPNTEIAAIVAHKPGTGETITNYVEVPNSDPGDYLSVQQQTGQFMYEKQDNKTCDGLGNMNANMKTQIWLPKYCQISASVIHLYVYDLIP